MIFSSIAFWKYELLLGNLVGIISFGIFIGSILLFFKIVFGKTKQENLGLKKVKAGAVMLFLVFAFLNLGVIALFVFFNYLYKNSNPNASVAFTPFNVLTIMTPYVLFSFQIVIVGFYNFVNERKSNKKRKEENGQTISS
ncbi:hypothetical protein AB5V95_00270 [Metamycoplasma spumans]|uniref:hypothetical protein n=1 Tax=Metamycoplasma spumans TaxID=92406 RepID=UPI001FE2028E